MTEMTAIICELNPLHNGHAEVLRRAKAEGQATLLVMSGNFTERGTPAVYDKYHRAEAAVRAGADLVLELPYPYAVSGAESFALGGIAVAAFCGATRFVFGSECGDLTLIRRIADAKKSPDFALRMAKIDCDDRDIGSGTVFDRVLAEYGITDPVGPNDKLGAEYVRFGEARGIFDYTAVRRIPTPSATELRGRIAENGVSLCADAMPPEAMEVFQGLTPMTETRYYGILFDYCRIRGEGSESELVRYAARVARDSETPEEFIRRLPTKKYTLSRLRRAILAALLGAPIDLKMPPHTSVLLAADRVGLDCLAAVKKRTGFTLVTKPADGEGDEWERMRRADELYALLEGKRAGEYMTKSPVIL